MNGLKEKLYVFISILQGKLKYFGGGGPYDMDTVESMMIAHSSTTRSAWTKIPTVGFATKKHGIIAFSYDSLIAFRREGRLLFIP